MGQRLSFLVLSVSILLIAASSVLHAQDPKTGEDPGKKNPFTSLSDVNQGRNFFNIMCTRCHGRNARGGRGPDLTDGVFRYARTDEEVQQIIVNGIPGTDMAGMDLTPDLAWRMVSYLRSEEKKRGTVIGTPPVGDLVRGAELFKQHKCATCHWTGSRGGRLGTNLSRLSASSDYVRKSLVDPNSQIDIDYQLLQIEMEDGTVLSGRRLNENTYYILLMDEKEKLHAIPKNRIEQLNRPHRSLMPSFKENLSTADIEDLASYIFSLRKRRSK